MRIKIAYIGGGSKMWARTFMNDLALTEGLSGEIGLYDIDIEAMKINKAIGDIINDNPKTISKFEYKIYTNIDECLKDSTFVIISILPGTFKEMYSDVHHPEKYGIYQSVGDTVGPGGILRAMRTVPIYEFFARKIKEICPNSWVINFTNPMSICVKTLYDVFPQIKAFGCCHEVFHAQEFLCLVLKKELNINVTRKDIYTDACGINHFTWITEAKYKDVNIFDYLPSFISKYYDKGYFERGDKYQYKYDCFAYGNKVKMDLFNKYSCLAAAGDRHLVEFLNNDWYIKNPKMVKFYRYQLTTVDYRIKNQDLLVEQSKKIAAKEQELELNKSNEEAVELLKAILGFNTVISNVNMPNYGQVYGLPIGSIVETNCIFSSDQVKPIVSNKLPNSVLNLVYRNCVNIDVCYEGIKNRDLDMIFSSFMNQPLCSNLTYKNGLKLFKEMILNTKEYLLDYYPNLEEYLSK